MCFDIGFFLSSLSGFSSPLISLSHLSFLQFFFNLFCSMWLNLSVFFTSGFFQLQLFRLIFVIWVFFIWFFVISLFHVVFLLLISSNNFFHFFCIYLIFFTAFSVPGFLSSRITVSDFFSSVFIFLCSSFFSLHYKHVFLVWFVFFSDCFHLLFLLVFVHFLHRFINSNKSNAVSNNSNAVFEDNIFF